MDLLLVLPCGVRVPELYQRLSHDDLLRILHLHVLGKYKDAFILEGRKVGLSHLAFFLVYRDLAEETVL